MSDKENSKVQMDDLVSDIKNPSKEVKLGDGGMEHLISKAIEQKPELIKNIDISPIINASQSKLKRRNTRIFKNVVIENSDHYYDNLSDEEKEFFNKMQRTDKINFLYMANQDRNLVMKKMIRGDNDRELNEIFNNCSKKAFHFLNEGQVFARQIDEKKNIFMNMAFALMFVAVGLGIATYYHYVIGKNRQLQLQQNIGELSGQLMIKSTAQMNINEGKPLSFGIGDVMKVEDYIQYIKQPNFKCEKIDSLNEKLASSSGMPKCKVNADGDVYIVGFASNGNYKQVMLHVKRDNKLYSFNVPELGIVNAKVAGVIESGFRYAPKSFASTFPEVVYAVSNDRLTKSKIN